MNPRLEQKLNAIESKLGIPYIISPSCAETIKDDAGPVHRLAISIVTKNGPPNGMDLTGGTITIYRVRSGLRTQIVNAESCSTSTGLIYYDYNFPLDDWQDGDNYEAVFNGQEVIILGTTYSLSPVYVQGCVEAADLEYRKELVRPLVSFIEGWQFGTIDPEIWTKTDPLHGTAWTVEDDDEGVIYIRAVPGAIESDPDSCRLVSNFRVNNPVGGLANVVTRRVVLEFEFRLNGVNWETIDDTTSILGFTRTPSDDRSSDDIVGFGVMSGGEWLMAVSRSGGVETITEFLYDLSLMTAFERFTIELTANRARFFIDGALVATHYLNNPLYPLYLNFLLAITRAAPGSIAVDLGTIRDWTEDVILDSLGFPAPPS